VSEKRRRGRADGRIPAGQRSSPRHDHGGRRCRTGAQARLAYDAAVKLEMSDKRRKRVLLGAVLLVLSSLLGVSLVELALKLSGFDTEERTRVSHPPNFHQIRRHLEFEYDFHTNRLGLRSGEVSKVKPKGASRLLLVGDSFVEGIGVNEDSTISSFLERDLSGSAVQVINGGLSHTGAFEQGRLIRHVGYGLDLDGLVLFVFDNDVFDAKPSQRVEDMAGEDHPRAYSGVPWLAHYLWPRTYTVCARVRAGHHLRLTHTDVIGDIMVEAQARGVSVARLEQWKGRVLPEYRKAIENGRIAVPIFSLSLMYPHFWSASIDVDTPEAEAGFAKMTELHAATIADARGRGIRIGVVYIPSQFQYDPASHAGTDPWVIAGADIRPRWLSEKTPIRERLEAWASKIGVPYLDMTPFYRKATRGGERLTWRLDEHLNARGNRYTAAVVADWLRRSEEFSFLHHAQRTLPP
jgi:hypothetical protein